MHFQVYCTSTKNVTQRATLQARKITRIFLDLTGSIPSSKHSVDFEHTSGKIYDSI